MPDDLTYRIKIDKDEALRDIREIREEIQKATTMSVSTKVEGSSSGKTTSGGFGEAFAMKMGSAFNMLGGGAIGALGREAGFQELVNAAGLRPFQQGISRPLRAQQMTVEALGMGAGFMDPKEIRQVNRVFDDILRFQDRGANRVMESTGGIGLGLDAISNVVDEGGAIGKATEATAHVFMQAVETFGEAVGALRSMFNGT